MLRRITATFLTTLVAGGALACAPDGTNPPKYKEHDSVDTNATAAPATTPPKRPQSAGEIVNLAAEDLSRRLGVVITTIEVLAIEPVVWDDGSLGCPQPERSYTAAQVPGMRVLFAYGGKNYQYHAANSGHFVLCPNPRVLAAPYAKE